MYFNDVAPKNGDNKNIDVACDEAIFRHIRNKKPEIRLMLGAWHTSKEIILIRTTATTIAAQLQQQLRHNCNNNYSTTATTFALQQQLQHIVGTNLQLR